MSGSVPAGMATFVIGCDEQPTFRQALIASSMYAACAAAGTSRTFEPLGSRVVGAIAVLEPNAYVTPPMPPRRGSPFTHSAPKLRARSLATSTVEVTPFHPSAAMRSSAEPTR